MTQFDRLLTDCVHLERQEAADRIAAISSDFAQRILRANREAQKLQRKLSYWQHMFWGSVAAIGVQWGIMAWMKWGGR